MPKLRNNVLDSVHFLNIVRADQSMVRQTGQIIFFLITEYSRHKIYAIRFYSVFS